MKCDKSTAMILWDKLDGYHKMLFVYRAGNRFRENEAELANQARSWNWVLVDAYLSPSEQNKVIDEMCRYYAKS